MDYHLELVRILLLSVAGFAVALVLSPWWIRQLKLWRMSKTIRSAAEAPVYHKYHAAKAGTPTMGGVVIWASVLLVALVGWIAAYFWPDALGGVSFISRSETYLPLGAFVAAALVGVVDDIFNVRKHGGTGGGLRVRHRLLIFIAIAAFGAYWFSFKLGWDSLHVPFLGDVKMGLWYIPFFMLISIATSFSVNETDGLDGLAGGTLAISFVAYAVLAFMLGRFDLSALCAIVAGTLVAFLWFNIPPARFIMGDTGSMALGTLLGIVAMLTNQALVLPLIGFVFVLESLSVIIQITSRKIRKKKVFLSAPLHHHLEALDWPESQIVMRLWMVAGVGAVLGIALAIVEPSSRLLS
jgi:phospho-N-acetylmuramoyl-pentapeptide-transferase